MWAQYGIEFLGLALVHFLAVILPGPDFAITVRNTIRFGVRIGYITAIGIGAGISIHVFYTLVGLGLIIQHHTWLMSIFRICGALYLIYLGWGLLRNHSSSVIDSNENIDSTQILSQWKAFSIGFMTNALNPKATIFFLAIFTTLVNPQTPMKIQIFYGIWMCMINALWFIVVAVLFSQPIVRNKFLSMGRKFETFIGIVFIIFAMNLIFTSL